MFKLGADPELFMKDATDAFRSAIGMIGGSKHDPRPLEIGDGFAVQEDNVAVEFNIPPADSREQFINNISRAMSFLSDEVARYGCHFVNVSSTNQFSEQDLHHPMALEFGCDPDFNAWANGKRNPRPKAQDHALRTCGGHVHIGYQFKTKQDLITFIKYCDLYLGVPAKLMDHGKERMQLYGKAGAFRWKSYGGEYRVLSNFWVFSPEYTGWVWDAMSTAMMAWQQEKVDIDAEGPMILDAINENNMEMAQALVQRHNLLMV